MKKVSISIQSKWWTNLPLLLRLDEDEAVENGEEEVENDEDDQIVVDQLEDRAPVTKFILEHILSIVYDASWMTIFKRQLLPTYFQ